MIHFDEKIYFYLLFFIPFFFFIYLITSVWKRKTQKKFAQRESLWRLAPEKSWFKQHTKFVIFLLIFLLIVIGLVNPKVGTKLETIKREGVDIVFAIDVSKSMLAQDVKPNRMEKTKHLISEIINELNGDRIAFVPYAAQAYAQLPLTSDYSAAKLFLQGLNTDMLSSQGTAIGEAIQVAANYFQNNTQTSKLIFILSDGEDHEKGVTDVIEPLKEKGIKIFTIGIGTEEGANIPIKEGRNITMKRDQNGELVVTKLNKNLLTQIAEEGNGNYFDGTNTREVISQIQNTLSKIEKNEYESQVFSDYKDQFQWFIAGALLLLFLDIFISFRKTSWIKRFNLFNEK